MSFTRSLIARRRDEEEGFTLIELMVVVLIIAILIAIAIPTFLGARQRAQDRAAQSDLRNGLTAEKTVYTDTQQYDATTANMKNVESSLNWNGASTTKPALTVNTADVTSVTPNITKAVVCLQEASKSGTNFFIIDVAAGGSAGTYFGKGTMPTCAEGSVAGLASSW